MTRNEGLQVCLNCQVLRLILAVNLMILLTSCSAQQSRPLASSTQASIQGNERIMTFRRAKKNIYTLFKHTLRTFYCECAYSKRTINRGDCGFRSSRHIKRGGRTEIEHVVPVHAFGQSFQSWREGHPKCVDKKGRRYRGRRCAKKVSPRFEKMSADLYNLKPVVGSVNALRSNFRMGVIEGEKRVFGSCDVEIENGVFEPRSGIRGDIARIYLYMDSAYPGHGIVGKKQRQLFEAWHRADPVSDEERKTAAQIRDVQGNENPFVTGNDAVD